MKFEAECWIKCLCSAEKKKSEDRITQSKGGAQQLHKPSREIVLSETMIGRCTTNNMTYIRQHKPCRIKKELLLHLGNLDFNIYYCKIFSKVQSYYY